MPHACIVNPKKTGNLLTRAFTPSQPDGLTHICSDQKKTSLCNNPVKHAADKKLSTCDPTDFGDTCPRCSEICTDNGGPQAT